MSSIVMIASSSDRLPVLGVWGNSCLHTLQNRFTKDLSSVTINAFRFEGVIYLCAACSDK